MKKITVIPSDNRATAAACETKTLLVVDDDAALRKFEVEMLRQLNYNVLEAEGPGQAMELAAATPRIHLLLTDFVMPEVNGLELAGLFLKLHPGAPVLMVSGSSEAIYGRAEYPDRFAVLAKPFTYEELAGGVVALLNTPATDMQSLDHDESCQPEPEFRPQSNGKLARAVLTSWIRKAIQRMRLTPACAHSAGARKSGGKPPKVNPVVAPPAFRSILGDERRNILNKGLADDLKIYPPG